MSGSHCRETKRRAPGVRPGEATYLLPENEAGLEKLVPAGKGPASESRRPQSHLNPGPQGSASRGKAERELGFELGKVSREEAPSPLYRGGSEARLRRPRAPRQGRDRNRLSRVASSPSPTAAAALSGPAQCPAVQDL
ncbi:E3 Sumo-Protein Ligase Ranbp2 [Manis pentadactyla]|nr:E3 Sumo-Protein Ligase Ranbp2 [Manis pentadactyla]